MKNPSNYYSNIPVVFTSAPYGLTTPNPDEMQWLRHYRMVVGYDPELIATLSQQIESAAVKLHPGYDPELFLKNMSDIIEKRKAKGEHNMKENKSSNFTADELMAAIKAGESEEFRRSQTEAIVASIKDDESLSVFNMLFMQRGNELKDRFVHEVLFEKDFEKCGDALLEIARGFEENPGLIPSCLPHRLVKPLEESLLSQMHTAAVKGEVPDALFFKYHYFQMYFYTIDENDRRSHFASTHRVRIAEFNQEPPLPPIKDIYMFKSVLGDAGSGAYAITFAQSVEHIKELFPLLRSAKNKFAVCSLLREQMTIVVLYELYLHSFTGGRIPDWLELKFELLEQLRDVVMPEECEELLSNPNLIDELLEEI